MTRVLVIEDHQATGQILLDEFRDRGCDVIWAPTCQSARAAFDLPDGFDVVICDYELPDGFGTFLIDAYTGTGRTIMFSGNDRTKEIAIECPNRQPDEQVMKSRLVDLIEMVAPRG